MRIRLIVKRGEDGAVAIMTALLAVSLIVVAAFTTDFGMAYAQRQALATGADSAALAVIQTEYTTQLNYLNRTCATALAQDNALLPGDPAKASTIALAQVNANAPFGTKIAGSDVVTTTLSCESGGTVLQVRVVVNRSMKPILGGVVGTSPMNLNREAKAALGVVNSVTDLAPITVCINQSNAIIAQHMADVAAGHPDQAQLVLVDKVWGSGTSCDGGGGSGNWGWLDFGNGVSVPDLVSYINGTKKTTVTLDASGSYWMNGTPGNKGNAGPVNSAMQGLMDSIVNLPVYSSVTGGGANTRYKVVGFLSVRLCGYQANKKNQTGACYAATPALVSDSMQVQFVNYSPVGQMGEVCPIGSPCATRAYITKLLG